MPLPVRAPAPDFATSSASGNPSSANLGVAMRLGPYGSIRRAGRAGDPEVRFHLEGEFDIGNRDLLASALRAGLDSRPATVDLLRTTFIDASIIGVFILLANSHGERARLRIANASRNLQLLFSICRLDEAMVTQ